MCISQVHTSFRSNRITISVNFLLEITSHKFGLNILPLDLWYQIWLILIGINHIHTFPTSFEFSSLCVVVDYFQHISHNKILDEKYMISDQKPTTMGSTYCNLLAWCESILLHIKSYVLIYTNMSFCSHDHWFCIN